MTAIHCHTETFLAVGFKQFRQIQISDLYEVELSTDVLMTKQHAINMYQEVFTVLILLRRLAL